jgi:hypothetical protein
LHSRLSLSARQCHSLALVVLLALIYVPYATRGGLLRDDLGFVTTPRDFRNYFAFQSHISSLVTMTARPVSAILHGASYWYFGAHSGAHHATNLACFAGSILLAYCAISRIVDPRFAFVTCAFAAVYPAAAGTVFSAMMMNSNLAGLFWAGALCLASLRHTTIGKDTLIALLLMLSGLSYESFVPLFAAVILARASRNGPLSVRTLLRSAAPVLVAVLILAIYRLALERMLFDSSFTRAKIPPSGAVRLWEAVLGGTRVAFIDTIRVSFRALRNISLVPPGSLLLFGAGVAVITVAVYRASAHRERSDAAGVWIAGATAFLAAHLIFVFSEYRPTLSGFESRTQGGIRFAASFLIASIAFLGATNRMGAANRIIRVAVPGVIATLFMLFAFGVVGQREGWIEAARYNREVVEHVDRALQATLGQPDSLTLIAELDRRSPHSENGEPTFGTSWDLGPALELANPGLRVRANVYEAKRTRVDPEGVTIDGYWRAPFPFYYFRLGEARLRKVTSGQDWAAALSR